jgi:hypothetical protein
LFLLWVPLVILWTRKRLRVVAFLAALFTGGAVFLIVDARLDLYDLFSADRASQDAHDGSLSFWPGRITVELKPFSVMISL